MRRITWMGLGLLVTLTTVVMLEGRRLAELQRDHDTLLAARQEGEQLAAQNRTFADSRVPDGELEAMRLANRDLPRMRNEIRQWREQCRELEKLQAENARLAAQIKAGAIPPKSITDVEGCVARDHWSPAGFATPEDAVQTFFWATTTGTMSAIADCLEPSERDDLIKQFNEATEEQRQRMVGEFNPPGTMKGFRIVEKKVEAEGKIILRIQAAADGELLFIPMRRTGAEWKIARLSFE
jgi:hypothetical protein